MTDDDILDADALYPLVVKRIPQRRNWWSVYNTVTRATYNRFGKAHEIFPRLKEEADSWRVERIKEDGSVRPIEQCTGYAKTFATKCKKGGATRRRRAGRAAE